jgi:hypothetical protein
MAEQTFLSPGFFENEIDLTQRTQEVTGVPGGIVGVAEKGPAFIPVTVGSFTDFQNKFGGLDDDMPATYAAYEFLKNKTALTYVRVLGAGGNATGLDIAATQTQGTTRNAGFKITPTNLSVPTVAAAAAITVTNLSAVTTDDRIQTIIDNSATPKYARIIFSTSATTNTSVAGSGTSGAPYYITVGCSSSLTTQQVAELFKTAVDSLNTAGFGVTATRDSGSSTVALTQVNPGISGNTTITKLGTGGGSYTSTGITVSSAFAGGKTDSRQNGAVQFIVAKHIVTANEAVGFPVFSDNDSFTVGASPGTDTALLVRAVLLTPSGTRFHVLDHDQNYSAATVADDTAVVGASTLTNEMAGKFKLVISSSAPGFSTAEGKTGLRIYTASLNPRSSDYIYNILNTDPNAFQREEHLLLAHFPVEPELANVTTSGQGVAIVSGSLRATSANSGDTTLTYSNAFGRFDSRYTTARTSHFISQPFGTVEHDLFYFEALDDGAVGNTQVKISISNIRKSDDARNPYGTFDVLVRRFDDTDRNIQVLEQFPQCDLNPVSDRYIGRIVGDLKTFFNFDAENVAERRFVTRGTYANRSTFVRVVVSDAVLGRTIPAESLPFGFRGPNLLKTNNTLTDGDVPLTGLGETGIRLGLYNNNPATDPLFERSILPPIPYRFKVTEGEISTRASGLSGDVGVNENVDGRLFWGVKFEEAPDASVIGAGVLNTNAGGGVTNKLIENYSKFLGIQKLDLLVTGSGADKFCNNKFTLARVALPNRTVSNSIALALTGTAEEHMLGAAYIRNGTSDTVSYTIQDPQAGTTYKRITLASVLSLTSSVYFNRFSTYAKFTNFLYGGFDGVNYLDKDMRFLNDRSTSADGGGKATTSVDIGIANPAGTSYQNNGVASYNAAVDIITNPMNSRINLLAVPGIRDPLVADHAMDRTKEYSKAAYIADIPAYTEDGYRVFAKNGLRPDVQTTSDRFAARNIDNNYVATYFPDVVITDGNTGRKVTVPASVPALGAIGYSDKVAYPWYAPAGFSRGALSFVNNTQVRLNSSDRDTLYTSRINPIARLPDVGYVIFGQKTLQIAKSSLDRLNVRRMLLEVKRIVGDIAMTIVFEQNTPATRAKFVDAVTPQLALIQLQQGIESFQVIMDSRNNTEIDVEANRLNGRIVIVPTRTVEFIAIDFVVTNAGVSFG